MGDFLFKATKGTDQTEHWVTEAEASRLRQVYAELGWDVSVRDPSQCEAYAKLLQIANLKYDRKPEAWTHVRAGVGRSQLPVLPIYEAEVLGVAHAPLASFRCPVEETVFLVSVNQGDVYLVNTEGANYCRYVARVLC